MDNYRGPGRTSLAEWQAALDSLGLEDQVDFTAWSVSEDGIPTADDIRGYGAFIIDIGDYEYEQPVLEQMPIELLESVNWFLLGEQPGDPDYDDSGLLVDLIINEPNHPRQQVSQMIYGLN